MTIRDQLRRLRDRNDRQGAIDGRGGQIHELPAVKLVHDLEEVQRRRNVAFTVRQRNFGRLSDGFVRLGAMARTLQVVQHQQLFLGNAPRCARRPIPHPSHTS